MKWREREHCDVLEPDGASDPGVQDLEEQGPPQAKGRPATPGLKPEAKQGQATHTKPDTAPPDDVNSPDVPVSTAQRRPARTSLAGCQHTTKEDTLPSVL